MAANGTSHSHRALARDRSCQFQGQACLPDSSGSDECNEARGWIGQPLAERLYFSIPAEKDRQRHGQRDAGQFIDRRGLRR
jgi:hypothetical protein